MHTDGFHDETVNSSTLIQRRLPSSVIDVKALTIYHKCGNRTHTCLLGFGDPRALLPEIDDLNFKAKWIVYELNCSGRQTASDECRINEGERIDSFS